MRLAMVMPTRGRPAAAHEAADAALETAESPDTEVWMAIDGDRDEAYFAPELRSNVARCLYSDHLGMVATLNRWALRASRELQGRFTHLGFMGDDHRPRTPGWDTKLMEAAGDGLAYGNDLIQGPLLPTAVVMNADIVRALGFMGPDVLGHLYIDDYWLALGRGLNRITYLDQVVIEHMHPDVGKSPTDEQYQRVNSPEQYQRDNNAWKEYVLRGELANDIDTVRHYWARRDAVA